MQKKIFKKTNYVVFLVMYLCFSLCKIRTFCFKPLLVNQSHGLKCTGFVLEETELRTHAFKPVKMVPYMTWLSLQQYEIEFKMIKFDLKPFELIDIGMK